MCLCQYCNKDFISRKIKKFCCKECYYKSRDKSVTLICAVCKNEFIKPYRFRKTVTCSRECFSYLMKSKNTSVKKECQACKNEFEVSIGSKEKTKFCSYECFLSTRKTRLPKIPIICKYCKIEFFVTPGDEKKRQFCNKTCANSGQYNAMFGKTSQFKGKPAWNRGLSTETDERVALLGAKISNNLHKQFLSGLRSHKGSNNPNYGNTSDKISDEKRRKYSSAAAKRIIDGLSGFKTRHLTGTYTSKKSNCNNQIKFRSSWELAALLWFDLSESIVSYSYEPFVFILDDGRRTVPDFLVKYASGEEEIIEIKPTALQKTQMISEKLKKTKDAVESKGYKYTLFGNAEIDKMKEELGEIFLNEVKNYQSR